MAYKGIYILVTKDEYRIFAGDITNIYVGIDSETGDYVIDPVAVKSCFGKSEVISSKECAFKAALEVSKITGEVEDGIYSVT